MLSLSKDSHKFQFLFSFCCLLKLSGFSSYLQKVKCTCYFRLRLTNRYNTILLSHKKKRSFISQFQWLSHFNSLFPQYNITLNSSENIIVPAPEYLRNMADVVLAADNV